MMRHCQSMLIGSIVVTLAASCWAVDLFPTAARREGFLKALAEQDRRYDADTAWVDIVLYQGLTRSFDFSKIEEAAVLFTLSMCPASDSPTKAEPAISKGIAYGAVPGTQTKAKRKKWLWQRTNNAPLTLTIPVTPLPTKEQKNAAAARRASIDPWEALQ